MCLLATNPCSGDSRVWSFFIFLTILLTIAAEKFVVVHILQLCSCSFVLFSVRSFFNFVLLFPVGKFWAFRVNKFCLFCNFSCFWIYVCLMFIFLSQFSSFIIFRFLLFTVTIIINILLPNICIKLTCTNVGFGFYFTEVPIKDVTYRVLIFP